MTNPFSWDYLTAPIEETAVWGPFSIAFALIFATGLIVAIFLNYDSNSRLKNRPLLHQTVQRATWIGIAVFGIGLFFFMFRVLQISAFGLHMRIWVYLSALAAAIMLVYFWYYARNVYPRKVAAEEAEARKQAYINRPAHRGSGNRKQRRKKKRA